MNDPDDFRPVPGYPDYEININGLIRKGKKLAFEKKMGKRVYVRLKNSWHTDSVFVNDVLFEVFGIRRDDLG